MADELDALRQAIEQFPSTVTALLRAVAWRKSREVKDLAKSRAPRNDSNERGRLNAGNPHLADSIVIIEDDANRQFKVEPDTPWNPQLGNWIEYGTVKMRARPFMRPAGDQVEASYVSEMTDAANSAADDTFGNL